MQFCKIFLQISVLGFLDLLSVQEAEGNDFFQIESRPRILHKSHKGELVPGSHNASLTPHNATDHGHSGRKNGKGHNKNGTHHKRKHGRKHHKQPDITTPLPLTPTSKTPLHLVNKDGIDFMNLLPSAKGRSDMEFNIPVISTDVQQVKAPASKKVPVARARTIPHGVKSEDSTIHKNKPAKLQDGESQGKATEKAPPSLDVIANNEDGSAKTQQGKRQSTDNDLEVDSTRSDSDLNTTGVIPPIANPPYVDFPLAFGNIFRITGTGDVLSPDANVTMENYAETCKVQENEAAKKLCDVVTSIPSEDDVESRKLQEEKFDARNLIDPGGNAPAISDKAVTSNLHLVGQQNRKLVLSTLKDAVYGKPENETEFEPVNGFKLLNLTRLVFSRLCPEHVIKNRFLEMIAGNFRRLHDLVSPGRNLFINDTEYGFMEGILLSCHDTSRSANYIQDTCKEQIIAVNQTNNPLCLGFMISEGGNVSTHCYQTRLEVFDPVLDLVWLMFEAVKAHCFNSFQGNIRLFQRYGAAMLDLYTRPMKFRWPLQRESVEFWERLMGPGLDMALTNIDKCVHQIIKTSPFDFRTPRFFNVHTTRLSFTHEKYLLETPAA